MRVVIVWQGISGYLAASWRELARRDGVELSVVVIPSFKHFSPALVEGLDVHVLGEAEQDDTEAVVARVAGKRPDVVVLSGWAHGPSLELPFRDELAGVKFVMGMDTPWRGTVRQRLARFKLWRYLGRMDRVVVPGERAWQFARQLGVPEDRIRRGMYGIDYEVLAGLHGERAALAGGWPRKFLYVGRYAEEKGIDVLVEGYGRYREQFGESAWPLNCAGSGAQAGLLSGVAGVTDLGFVQPADQAAVWRGHGAFVLASRFDPWPLVVVEACAAGLPVVCTEACGSGVELVRPHYNGMTVASEDAGALADGLVWAHRNYDGCAEMGARSRQLAAAYSAQAWATRWVGMFEELVRGRDGAPPRINGDMEGDERGSEGGNGRGVNGH
jgi:glycosyltransferase involved in cell wall biosynthesis